MLKTILYPIIVGLVLWGVQDHFKDVPTATYLISDAIEIPSSQGAIEYAQEIVVSNKGRSPAKVISIKVPRHISSFKLTKHSSLTKEEIVSEQDGFELVYPELPSGQKFKILIRYNGTQIQKNWIAIGHSDGVAQNQETQTSPINYSLLWIVFMAGFLTQSSVEFLRWRREAEMAPQNWTSG